MHRYDLSSLLSFHACSGCGERESGIGDKRQCRVEWKRIDRERGNERKGKHTRDSEMKGESSSSNGARGESDGDRENERHKA